MQFNHFSAARVLMKPVNILCNKAFQSSPLPQFSKSSMGGIGLRLLQFLKELMLHSPVLNPCFMAGNELLIGNYTVPFPDSPFAAEIRNPRLSGYPCPGKGSDPL